MHQSLQHHHDHDDHSHCAHNIHRINHQHTSPLMFATASNDEHEDEEECSIKKIYEQVQMDDTEWYEQTFSKLLSLDDGEQNNDITALIDASCASSSVGDVYGNKENELMQNIVIDNDVEEDQVDGNTKLKEDKRVDDSFVVVEAGNLNEEDVATIKPREIQSDIISERRNQTQPDESQQLPQQQIVNEDVEDDVDGRSKSKSINEGVENKPQMRQDRVGDYEEEYNHEELDDYDEGQDYEVEEDEEVDYETQESQINQGQEKKKTKPRIPQESDKQPITSSTTNNNNNLQQPSSINIVRLRNTFTNEIENLSPLSSLLNLGYTENELVVLKPMVLELIVEDNMKRPDKGLPKRWVRLNKLRGYEDEVDDYEEDVDYGWEVEIVSSSRKSLATKKKELSSNKVDTEQQLAETTMEPEQLSKASEVEDVDGRAVKSVPKALQQSTKSASRPKNKVSTAQERSESATIERDDGAKQSKAPTRVDSRREQSQQRKRKSKPDAEEDVPYSRRGYQDDDDDESSEDEYSRQQQRRRPKQQRRQREYDDDTSYNARTPPPGSRQQRQRRKRNRPQRQQRDLYIDRGNYDDDEPPPNKFWMDLPTFRDFLRKEAQLRLNILGPDWKESVLDESRWRYDLYKTWLTMLDEGVGEDLLDGYVDRQPGRERRRRRRPPPPPPPSTKAQSPQSIEREGYDRRPPRPQRRQSTSDLNDNYDDEENYDMPLRPKARTESQREGDRQRSRRRPPPPPKKKSRNTSWRNFNDLEQILVESSQDRSMPERRDYPSHSSRRNDVPIIDDEEYDDDDEEDEEDDDYYRSFARELPRKGRRKNAIDKALQEEEDDDAATLSRRRRDDDNELYDQAN